MKNTIHIGTILLHPEHDTRIVTLEDTISLRYRSPERRDQLISFAESFKLDWLDEDQYDGTIANYHDGKKPYDVKTTDYKPLTVGKLREQLDGLNPEIRITTWNDGDRRFAHALLDDSMLDDNIIEINLETVSDFTARIQSKKGELP